MGTYDTFKLAIGANEKGTLTYHQWLCTCLRLAHIVLVR